MSGEAADVVFELAPFAGIQGDGHRDGIGEQEGSGDGFVGFGLIGGWYEMARE
jgi:hypothetical protein